MRNDKVGVILANLGTPDSPQPADVRRYLAEFLWDPRVIKVWRPLWWLILNLVILNTRPKKSAEAYQSIWKLLADGIPEFKDFVSADQIPQEGFHLGAGVNPDLRFNLDWIREKEHTPDREEGFELLLTDWTFGTEELSSLSPCLIELEREPCMVRHVGDAKELGCTDGDFVEITTELGSLQVMVALDQTMAPGVLCLPRHPRLPWRIFKDIKITIKKDHIKKRL